MSKLYDFCIEAIAFIIYYMIVCCLGLLGFFLWKPILLIGRVYGWAKKHAPLEQK